MKTALTALALTALVIGASQAQTSSPPSAGGEPETVYSQAQREKDISAARWVMENMLHPSFSLDGEYARWEEPICPHVYGLKPVPAWLIEHRIREVAQRVGAPVDRNDPCTPNIGIIFTSEPQASLMSIADKAPLLIQGGNQKLRVNYPVQAWYATFAVSNNGHRMVDIPWEMITPPVDGPPMLLAVDSTRLSTGVTAQMAAATVLVDTSAVMGMTAGELGDYLALMTLAQAGQYGACLDTASVANLMLKCGAENTVHALSHIDLALLAALYETPPWPEKLQKQRITGAIRRNLDAQAAAAGP